MQYYLQFHKQDFAVLPLMFPWRHIPCAVLSSLPCRSAPFTIMAVYLISDGNSIFRSSLNWLHHTPKNQNSRIISMVENSRKNAPFFPIGKPEAHCKFMLKYVRISASGKTNYQYKKNYGILDETMTINWKKLRLQ